MSQVEWVALGGSEKRPRAVWLAPLSVVLGSLVTLLPIIATVPILPPMGLLFLLGWRLHRTNSMPVWAPVLLGLFDDLVSGQPLGSAMVLWSLCCIMTHVIDTRLMWRDFWQDWLIATGAIFFCLIGGRLVATPIASHVDTALLLQIIISAALFSVIARFCAWMDRDTKPE